MAISKTKNNTYRVRLYYSQDIQERLGVGKLYSKTFKTNKEAKDAKIYFYASIKEIRESKDKTALELGGEALFKDFYENIWLDAYVAWIDFYKYKSTNSGYGSQHKRCLPFAYHSDVWQVHAKPS